MIHFIQEARSAGMLKPGAASKLFGCTNFFQEGIFGKVGKAGLGALKDRQYERTSALTPTLESAFQLLESVLAECPRRLWSLAPANPRRFVVASNAALETPRQGQLELLMVLAALSVYREHFRARTGLWFLDNVAALMAVVRGRSDTPDLDQLAISNWSDAISRLGADDPWSELNQFYVQQSFFRQELCLLPMRACIKVFSFM